MLENVALRYEQTNTKKARNNHTHFYENKTELFRKRSAKWKNVNVFFCVVLWAEKMETFKNDDVFLVM